MLKGPNGSELHRLKKFDDDLDTDQFNRLYKVCLPIIKRLSYNIDLRKYDVSRDIIQSYFTDKFMYVYNKYYKTYDEDRLKYVLISSLTTFKNKLLRSAYTKQGEWNSSVISFEDLLEQGEWEEHPDPEEDPDFLFNKLYDYLKNHLTPDEYLLFRIQLDPPPFFDERIVKAHGRVTAYDLIEFFDWPKTIRATELISEMRDHIQEVLSKASKDLNT